MLTKLFRANAPDSLFVRLHITCGIALLLLGLSLSWPANAARLALVIGNDSYREIEPLRNARNDARLMAATLKEAGFEVERVHENLDRKAMQRAIIDFKARITKADEVFFFYAGHGVQIGQQSPVLLPIDITQENDDQIVQDSVQLSWVQEAVKEAQFALLVIDACRDNPFPRKNDGSRGLVRTGLELTQKPLTGSMVVMSAGTGEKALDYVPDGTRGNGLFTHEFVQAIKSPGKALIMAILEARGHVTAKAQRAGNKQHPAYLDESSGGTFVFFPAQAPVAAPVAVAPSVQLTSEQEVEQKLWNAIESSNDVQDFQDYLKRYPNGRFAPLAQRQLRVLTARQQPTSQEPATPVLAVPAASIQTSAAAPTDRQLGKRVALLIGNEGSFDLRLFTPFRDVQLIEATLRPLGFSVNRLKNASRNQMRSAINDFREKAKLADIALIYFAGQGYRIAGIDHLHPYDISASDVSIFSNEGIKVQEIVDAIDQRAKSFGMVIVDAGRDELQGTRGLGYIVDGISLSLRTGLVFSTGKGTSPWDGLPGAENSPFATSLAANLKNADFSIQQVLEQTKLAVSKATNDAQVPQFVIGGGNNIYLAKHLATSPTR